MNEASLFAICAIGIAIMAVVFFGGVYESKRHM